MRVTLTLILLFAGPAMLAGCGSSCGCDVQTETPDRTEQTPSAGSADRPVIGRMSAVEDLPAYEYAVYVPAESAADRPWPTILYLHGSGMRGDDIDRIKSWPMAARPMDPNFPFLVVMPQCPEGQRWNPQALSALLDEIEQQYPVDPNRIYLTGQSMGGYGTWALAQFQPQRFAALVPVCGRGDPNSAELFVDTPIWAFHGQLDQAVPVSGTTDMVEAIRAAGGEPRVRIYPDQGHQIWDTVYGTQQLYDWLLAQRRR